MKALVLGGSGFIGRRLGLKLSQAGWSVQLASRGVPSAADGPRTTPGIQARTLDTCDLPALTQALREVDAVVNAVAGRPRDIAQGARTLAQALRQVGGRPVVHLSSMAVYGTLEGTVDAATPLGPLPSRAAGSPYAQAKREAEQTLSALAAEGGSVALLRPGCVWGPGSVWWVDRLARLLQAGRLGDLGADGDGWTHGVHVDDVCAAVLQLLRTARTGLRVYPLAAPDSPRWNTYLHDLALAIDATPLARPPRWQLQVDAWLVSPPLQLLARTQRILGMATPRLPPPLPPGLLALMARSLRMDANAATQDLGLVWTPYARSLRDSAADWLLRTTRDSVRARNKGLPTT